MENDQAPGLEARASQAANHRKISGVSMQEADGTSCVRRRVQGLDPPANSQLFLDSNLNSSSCGWAPTPERRVTGPAKRGPRLILVGTIAGQRLRSEGSDDAPGQAGQRELHP
jgi:hypothetical protein